MEKKENRNEMLSFDKLREELGIEGELPTLEDIEFEEIDEKYSPKQQKEPAAEKNDVTVDGKTVVENGKTFIDITAQYTDVTAFENTVKKEEVPEIKKDMEVLNVPVTPKKRVRTFNEIFVSFFSSFIPVKSDSGKEKVRKIIMDISVITIVICLFGFGKFFVEYQFNLTGADRINKKAVIAEKLNDNEYVSLWKKSFGKGSTIKFPKAINPAYAYPYSVNQDLVGWLKIDGVDMDTQIVQGSDNTYYAERDFYKKKNNIGSPYLDSKNNAQELDDNTIIYASNAYFSCLDVYKTVEGYQNSPTIEFGTLYESYSFKVFAAFYISGDTMYDGGFNYKVTDFTSDVKFNNYINEIKLRSLINTDVSVQTADKIITLVVPSDEFDGAQFVVMGRMVRDNESAYVDVDSVTVNESPKYPQAWYDKKGIDNPFSK